MKIGYLVLMLAFALLPSLAHAGLPPMCKAEKGAWPNNYDVTDGCRYRFASPTGDRAVEVDGQGRFGLIDHSDEIDLGPFGAPSQVAWSPDGRYVYINDGENSGLDSALHLYDLSGDEVIDRLTIRRDINRMFAARLHCQVSDRVPTTWGLGWAKDASQLYVFVQALPGQYCAGDADFYVATVALPSGRVLALEPDSIARQKFHALLPRIRK